MNLIVEVKMNADYYFDIFIYLSQIVFIILKINIIISNLIFSANDFTFCNFKPIKRVVYIEEYIYIYILLYIYIFLNLFIHNFFFYSICIYIYNYLLIYFFI